MVLPADAPADYSPLIATIHGRCVFHNPVERCAIHAALGHDALPMACRQFPRSSVTDPRGVSITLSHYCPTAAEMLESAANAANDGDIRIDATGFPVAGEYVGLDARLALPPLLRPGMLMDWASWWEVERRGVETLLHSQENVDRAVGRVRGAVEFIRRWSPSEGPLIDRVRVAFAGRDASARNAGSDLVRAAVDAVPEPYQSRANWVSQVTIGDLTARRFAAAHAFANWTVHMGGDLRTWLRSVETAWAFLQAGAGVSHADLVLRHLIDLEAWTRTLKTLDDQR
jgi:hypothetical protein